MPCDPSCAISRRRERALLEGLRDRVEGLRLDVVEEPDSLEKFVGALTAGHDEEGSAACRRLPAPPSCPAPVEPLPADRVERLATLPESDRLVDVDVAGLEALDDRAQLALAASKRGLLALTASTSSTRRRLPCASSTENWSRGGDTSARANDRGLRADDRVAAREGRAGRERGGGRRAPPVERGGAPAAASALRGGRRPARAARAGGRRPRAPPRSIELRGSAERRRSSSSRSGTTSRAAAVGVAARTSAARSQSGASCSWPIAETTGTAQARPRGRAARR